MGRTTVQDGRWFAYALEFPMDIMTSIGLASGVSVVTLIMVMGGDLQMFWSEHAVIIIFGGSIAATMIRFPLSAILHGLPLGARFAFTMSRLVGGATWSTNWPGSPKSPASRGRSAWKKSKPTSHSSPRAFATSPMATISNSSVTISNATATTS